MAGWLAWNLRIVTGVAIALCGYYGADYWSNKDTERNIERIDFQDQFEWEEPEKEHLKPGKKAPAIAKKRFAKMSNSSGGAILGADRLLEIMEKRCADSPQTSIYDPDPSTRRYCRLYWSVSENINWLIKYENKHILLTTETETWKTKWQEYKLGTKPWGDFTPDEEEAPKAFKDKCIEKSKGSVNDIDDKEYEEVIKYCSRDKTIKDVLNEEKIRLLADSETTEWQKRTDSYKATKIGVKFHNDAIIRSGDHAKLIDECKKSIELRTTIVDYKNILGAIKTYCKASG